MIDHKLKENFLKNHLTEAQLLSYKEGSMNEAEMHAVERHMLECEFCKDAVEGFSFIDNKDSADILDELRNEIYKKTSLEKILDKRWRFAIAASILLIMSIGITILMIIPLQEKKDVIVHNSPANSENIELEKGQSLSDGDDKSTPHSFMDSGENKKELKKIESESDFISENSERNLDIAEKDKGKLYRQDKDNNSPVSVDEAEHFAKKEREVGPFDFANKSRLISGKVTDEAGEPLAGTIINIAGTNITSISNASGHYSITSPNTQDTLIFNNLGYEKAEIAFSESDKKINTKLFQDTTSLDRIAAVGSSQEKRGFPSASPSTVLKTKKPLIISQGNKNQISGQVFNEGGRPLSGVSVQIKGTSEGAMTDNNGKYSLSLPSSSANLVFSSQGYSTEEMEVNSSSTQTTIILNQDHNKLSKAKKTDAEITGQDKSYEDNYPPMPEIEMSEYKKYLKENLRYTDAARSQGVEGEVVVGFFIESDGRISDIKIIKGLGYGLDEEAIRLVTNGPAWKSGRKDGVNNRQQAILKIPFSLK